MDFSSQADRQQWAESLEAKRRVAVQRGSKAVSPEYFAGTVTKVTRTMVTVEYDFYGKTCTARFRRTPDRLTGFYLFNEVGGVKSVFALWLRPCELYEDHIAQTQTQFKRELRFANNKEVFLRQKQMR